MDMTFKSLKDAENFYEEYEKVGGFENWSSSIKFSINWELIEKSFVCVKEGQKKAKQMGLKEHVQQEQTGKQSRDWS